MVQKEPIQTLTYFVNRVIFFFNCIGSLITKMYYKNKTLYKGSK